MLPTSAPCCMDWLVIVFPSRTIPVIGSKLVMLPHEANNTTIRVLTMRTQLGRSWKYRQTTISSSRNVAPMNTLTPLIVRARGSKAGRFCAPINRLLIRGDVESSASNQAEVTVTTLIEAIQLDQLKSLIELFTGPPLAQLMVKPPAKLSLPPKICIAVSGFLNQLNGDSSTKHSSNLVTTETMLRLESQLVVFSNSDGFQHLATQRRIH